MPKRQTHAKKSVKPKRKKRSSLPIKKGTKQSHPKRGTKNLRGDAKKISRKHSPSKVVPKGATIYKAKASDKRLPRHKDTGRLAKRKGINTTDTKGRKTVSKSIVKSKGKVRSGLQPKTKGTIFTKKISSSSNRQEQRITKREIRKKGFTVVDKNKLKTSENFRHDKEGKRLKEKTITGYRKYFRVDLPKGTFEQNINRIRNGNFTFLNKGLFRNKTGKGSKEPRAVVITIETSYRGKKHYFRRISPITFVVRKDNVKKLILEQMIDYQDDWLERQDENEDYLQESGKEFAPKNITGVNIEFIY